MCICCLATSSCVPLAAISSAAKHLFSLSLGCFCITAVSRYFYHRPISWYGCYLSSISYCRYNSFDLFCIDCTESMYRRNTHDLRVFAIGWPKPILVAFLYRSNTADRSLVSASLSTYFYQSIYRLKDRLSVYRSCTLNHTPIGCTSLNSCAGVIESMQPHLVI
jgi:hypothetical protein